MVDLSVCIVSFNACDVLRDCLRSLYEHTPPSISLEVIVVDNNSRDQTLSMLSDEFPLAKVIANETNLGFSKATNQAMRASSGRYICWLNSDTIVLPNAMPKLIRFMDSNPKAGIVGPKILNADGSFQPQCKRGFPTPLAIFSYYAGLDKLFPNSPFFAQYLLRFLSPDQPHEVVSVSGACLLARRELLESVGYADENIFAFGEDIDWCVRARNSGWEVWYYPEAQIIHLGGKGGSGSMPFRAIYEYHRSMWVFYRKHLINRYIFPLHIIVAAGIGARFAWSVLRNAMRKEKLVGSRKTGS